MNTSKFSLNGKVAIVTGGSRGIGFAIAREYINLGARVAICGTTAENLSRAGDELGDACFTYVLDVTRKDQHAVFVEAVEQRFGPVDILVNNAGRHCKKPSLDCSVEEFQSVLDTNLASVFSLTMAVLPGMIRRGNGSIINISSMAALFGIPQVSAYSSSKGGLLALTRSLASEYSNSGVRFNCIAPGYIESEMLRKALEKDAERERKILSRTPMKRFGEPSEIGYAAAFLASDASAFITGVCLPVDGGAAIGF